MPVLVGTDGGLTELGQASRTGGTLTLLPPGIDSEEGIWVKVASDGTLVEVADLSQLSNHGWAWKYPDHTGVPTLHQIRGTVRNVPGEDYYLTEGGYGGWQEDEHQPGNGTDSPPQGWHHSEPQQSRQ